MLFFQMFFTLPQVESQDHQSWEFTRKIQCGPTTTGLCGDMSTKMPQYFSTVIIRILIFSVKNKIVSDDGVVLGERYWVVHDFRSNKPSANKTLRSSEKDFYHLPVSGWTYYSGAEWILDENLRVIGKICKLT